jgi:predicted branched-subunit amino acid permease
MAAGASDAPVAAVAGTWLIYSGSAHLAVLGGLSAGEGLLAVVAAGLSVNVRLLAYSATLSARLRHETTRFRALAAALVVDPLWALVTARAPADGVRRYYLGAGLVLWFGWAAAVGTGAVLGQHAALAQAAAVGVPLCMVTLVAPHARSRRGAACVGAGAAVGLLSAGLPAGTGVLASMVAGALAGAVVTALVRRAA